MFCEESTGTTARAVGPDSVNGFGFRDSIHRSTSGVDRFLNLNGVELGQGTRQTRLSRGGIPVAPDATTAQILVKSGFNIASLQDCREPNGSWNITARGHHLTNSRHRMQQELINLFLERALGAGMSPNLLRGAPGQVVEGMAATILDIVCCYRGSASPVQYILSKSFGRRFKSLTTTTAS
ncbi:hypothetical protein BDR06DRAFT_1010861 [Suillus hirtellus]|nr:hypothetical protein BDR06DRAFT_1010861 [Suillus hirtellus]